MIALQAGDVRARPRASRSSLDRSCSRSTAPARARRRSTRIAEPRRQRRGRRDVTSPTSRSRVATPTPATTGRAGHGGALPRSTDAGAERSSDSAGRQRRLDAGGGVSSVTGLRAHRSRPRRPIGAERRASLAACAVCSASTARRRRIENSTVSGNTRGHAGQAAGSHDRRLNSAARPRARSPATTRELDGGTAIFAHPTAQDARSSATLVARNVG